MGLLKKIGRGIKKGVRKIVPKELSGIMRAAAPFVAASNPLAGIGLSVAGQLRSKRGRISPLETVLAAAPSPQFRGLTRRIPGGTRLDEILYGTRGQEFRDLDPTKGFEGLGSIKTTEGTRGILGMGGDFNPLKGTIIRDKKTGDVKLTNVLSLIGSGLTFLQAKNAIRREGEDLGLDEDEIVGLEGQLLDTYFPGFDPTGFRPDVPGRKDGGLMRTKFAMGSKGEGDELPPDPTKPIGVPPGFKPKPIGPVLPDKMMASYGYNEAMADTYDSYLDMKKNGLIPPTMTFDEFLQEVVPEMSMMKTEGRDMVATGGLMRTNYALGTRPTVQESGLGGLPIEADMRYTGGFMPYGAKEKADDVPARLSKNEFVFTADAVRAAGGGSINKGAKRMYNTMKQLESIGRA